MYGANERVNSARDSESEVAGGGTFDGESASGRHISRAKCIAIGAEVLVRELHSRVSLPDIWNVSRHRPKFGRLTRRQISKVSSHVFLCTELGEWLDKQGNERYLHTRPPTPYFIGAITQYTVRSPQGKCQILPLTCVWEDLVSRPRQPKLEGG